MRGHPFKKVEESELVCSAWFERDRANLTLSTPQGREIFSLWDEAVFEAIEDGFLTTPPLFNFNRGTDAEWQPHAVEYAKECGLWPPKHRKTT